VSDDAPRERGGGFVTGLLLGALGGVVLAAMASPRARGVAADAGGMVPEGLVQRGRSIIDAARARIEGAISEGRGAAERQRAELEDRT